MVIRRKRVKLYLRKMRKGKQHGIPVCTQICCTVCGEVIASVLFFEKIRTTGHTKTKINYLPPRYPKQHLLPACPSRKGSIKMNRVCSFGIIIIMTGTTKIGRKRNLSQCHCVHHKSRLDLHAIEPVPPR